MTEYITIQDFANKSGLSRQTVYRKLDNEWNKYYKEENGKKLISVEALAELDNKKSCNDDTTKNVLEVLKYTIENLSQQLQTKDEQIKSLTEALKTEQNISSQAHLLHAGTIKTLPEKTSFLDKVINLFKTERIKEVNKN